MPVNPASLPLLSLLIGGGCQDASTHPPKLLDRSFRSKRCHLNERPCPAPRGGGLCAAHCSVRCRWRRTPVLSGSSGGRVRRGGAPEEAHLPGNFGSQASARLLNWVCSSRTPKGCQHRSALAFSGLGGGGEVGQLPEILGTEYCKGRLRIRRKMNHWLALSLPNDRAPRAWLLQLGAGLRAAKLGQKGRRKPLPLNPHGPAPSWIRGWLLWRRKHEIPYNTGS